MAKEKSTFFIDFDGTLTDSVKAFCAVYSDRYKHHPNFTIPIPCTTTEWNMGDTCPLLKEGEVDDIFSDSTLFDYLYPFPNTVDVLNRLKKHFKLVVVSIGSYENIANKCKYIKEHFSMIDDFIGITNLHCAMDKSVINMSANFGKYNVFLDDNADNLLSQQFSTNLIRYCYGDRQTEWNKDWLDINGRLVTNWLDVERELVKWVNK